MVFFFLLPRCWRSLIWGYFTSRVSEGEGNSPPSIDENSNMTPRLSGHFPIFGLVFFVLKSLLGIARQWSRKKIESLGVMLGVKYIDQGLFLIALVLIIPHYLPCSQSLAITVESGDKARSHHPSLALLACLGCLRVPQSPLSLGKASGGGTLTRLSLRLLACHRHPTFKVRAPCSLRRQSPYNLHFPMVSGLGAILGFF